MDPPAERRLVFRPDIEGLRAVAVGLVVALHSGVTSVSGGYIGVDVFFVISGFLITSLMIREIRTTQRVSIVNFYARRARRILPAACFVLAATVLVAYLQLGPFVGRTTAIDGQWAAGFAANFRFIRQGTDYFASALPPSPLQHYWSLAVEEQFYLVWPTLLFGLVLLGRRFSRPMLTLRVGLITLVGASLYWSIRQSAIAPTTAYFSPLTRAWELGAGALIAAFSVQISRTPAPLRAFATWAGLALVMWAAFTFTATTEFPGYAALLPVGGSALVMAGGIGRPPGTAGLLLGVRPLRWLGRISFSVYLWHWPVLTIAEERSSTPLSGVARVVCVVVTLALSVASYYAIERPVYTSSLLKPKHTRNSWEGSRKALLLGATAIIVAVAVSVYTNNRAVYAIQRVPVFTATVGSTLKIESTLNPKQQVASLQHQVDGLVRQSLALHTIPADLDPPVLQIRVEPKYVHCLQARADTTVKPCTFGAVASKRILVAFGDSHATEWMPAIDRYGQDAGYRVVTVSKLACPVPSLREVAATGPYPQCDKWRSNALAYINALKPAVVVMAFSVENLTLGRVPNYALWSSGLRTSMRALVGSGARIVEIGNNAVLPQDPRLCLSRPHADPTTCIGTFKATKSGTAERQVVNSFGATYIDVEPWFCVHNQCPAIIDQRVVYVDAGHLAPQYTADLEPLLAASLAAAGLR